MPTINTFCSFCGAQYTSTGWPRRCSSCGSVTYRNPLPVAVALLPVGNGLLTVRRGIQPQQGQLALPGGFIDVGEDWAVAVARELYEETGIHVAAPQVQWYNARSSAAGHLLLFGLCPAIAVLPAFVANSEVSELVVIDQAVELAFPLHTQIVQQYFAERGEQ